MALSYCWGWDAASPSKCINMDGHDWKVTESLEAALRSIRDSKMVVQKEQPIKCWVDAVCINQSDASEVKQEILRMREIYSQATNLYVYLGTASEDSDVGMQFLERIADDMSNGVDVHGKFAGQETAEEDKKAYRAALRIFNRPYWNRVWVLQELAVSRNAIFVACGAFGMSLERLLPAANFLCLDGHAIVYYDSEAASLITIHLTLLTYILAWIANPHNPYKRPSVPSQMTYLELREPLLVLAQSAQATKSHDNVYGLLGLTPEPIREMMKPYVNYDLPIQEVYLAFSKAIIEHTGELDGIYSKNYSQTMRPSWATDWNLAFDRAGFPHHWGLYCYDQYDGAYEDLREIILSSRITRADAGRKSRVTFQQVNDATLLKCSGVYIATVDGIAPTMVEDLNESDIRHVQPTATANPYGDDEAVAHALIHTIFANPTWGGSAGASLFRIPWIGQDPSLYFNSKGELDFTPKDLEVIEQLKLKGWGAALGKRFIYMEYFRRRLSQFRFGNKRFQDFFDTEITQCNIPAQRFKLDIATILGASLRRRLVTLSTGHFGAAPVTIRPGDAIYVVLGCSIPIVLRPEGEDGYFNVIGECYVDGLMNGEAMAGADQGEYDIRDIVLC